MLAILTDSTCDIPDDLIQQYGIIVIPHYIIWGEAQYRDRVNLQPEEFYQMLQNNPQRPTTAQAGVGDFLEGLSKAKAQGATEAVILTVSSAMSGAYQMALTAAEQADIPVSVVDSRGPTMSLGWQALAAARARDAGATRAGAVAAAAAVRSSLAQFVAMETLEYLEYGGRIGDAVKWVGNILRVRPLVSIDHVSGRVQAAGLARTRSALLRMLKEKFFESFDPGAKLHIAVMHGNALEEAESLAEEIKHDHDPVELLINITGPVLGINTGPGALALCGYAEGNSN